MIEDEGMDKSKIGEIGKLPNSPIPELSVQYGCDFV